MHLCLCVENMSSTEDWRGGLFVCLGFVCVCGGKDGWCHCVSWEVCVFVFWGGVCRSRNSLLGWSGFRERERRVLCVCVCTEDIAIHSDFKGRHSVFSWHSSDVELERESETRGRCSMMIVTLLSASHKGFCPS